MSSSPGRRTFGSADMQRAGWFASIAFAALVIAIGTAPALAGPAAITLNVTGGGAVKFTSSDNTSSALAAGATLDLTWITVTCVDTGGSGWLSGGTATLVPNGPSAACATIPGQINNQTT